jgi:carboxyl-terminal processing protease
VKSPIRARWCLALLCCCGLFVCAAPAHALPEKQVRDAVRFAKQLEADRKWEEARELYELLLSQKDPGLNIRERYQETLRRCWQVRRHKDVSYRKEVLSIEYGQAMWLHKIITKTLLDDSAEKDKVDPTKLFRKGLEEFDAALSDPNFLKEYVHASKLGEVEAFRATLKKVWGQKANLTRDEAAKQIGEVASAAARDLGLDATVVVMEFACGACYAIDEYTAYLTPNQLRELANSLARSEAIGVGLVLAVRDNRIVVQSRAMGTQAHSQISDGDQVISVNKKLVAELPLQAVKELLEGPAGTMVDIELLGPDDTNTRMLSLMRERAPVPSVESQMLPGLAYGYLKINSFTETTVQDVDEHLAKLSNSNMKGLILDLRENNGGVFESAIDTAQRFLSRGIITSILHRNRDKNFVYQAKNPNALTLPIVLMIDGDTASAAEVLAGALKDNDRAYVIGQTTYGKGCTQWLLELPKSKGSNIPTGGMKLTVARFFSPKGDAYSGRGVTPHFPINDERMAASESGMLRGPYFEKAVEELNRMTMPK